MNYVRGSGGFEPNYISFSLNYFLESQDIIVHFQCKCTIFDGKLLNLMLRQGRIQGGIGWLANPLFGAI